MSPSKPPESASAVLASRDGSATPLTPEITVSPSHGGPLPTAAALLSNPPRTSPGFSPSHLARRHPTTTNLEPDNLSLGPGLSGATSAAQISAIGSGSHPHHHHHGHIQGSAGVGSFLPTTPPSVGSGGVGAASLPNGQAPAFFLDRSGGGASSAVSDSPGGGALLGGAGGPSSRAGASKLGSGLLPIPETPDDKLQAKKASRPRLSPWSSRGLPPLSEALRRGAKGSYDFLFRRRFPFSLRMTLFLLLTGVITVMVSFRSVTPRNLLKSQRMRARRGADKLVSMDRFLLADEHEEEATAALVAAKAAAAAAAAAGTKRSGASEASKERSSSSEAVGSVVLGSSSMVGRVGGNNSVNDNGGNSLHDSAQGETQWQERSMSSSSSALQSSDQHLRTLVDNNHVEAGGAVSGAAALSASRSVHVDSDREDIGVEENTGMVFGAEHEDASSATDQEGAGDEDSHHMAAGADENQSQEGSGSGGGTAALVVAGDMEGSSGDGSLTLASSTTSSLLSTPPPLPTRLQLVPTTEQYLWQPPPSQGFRRCIARSKTHKVPFQRSTNGYLMVTANGGLNQMRAAICDMVAVARIMNVTLVVPELDHSSFWADPSEFEDIFDLEHFITQLKKDVRIATELPPKYRNRKPLEIFPISWSPFSYYRKVLLPQMKKRRVMRFPLTDSRLSNNDVPDSIQRLRCRANYRALKYTQEIEGVADNLIQRLRARGPYIALHLRYEKDMLAFTGCGHGLTVGEEEELRVMRYNNTRWKEKDIDGEGRRRDGLCPLTPRETALFLRALGYTNRTTIYIAAGDIYGSHGLTDLTRLYPNTVTHSTLATAEELARLRRYQNRMAAVDYTVAVESDVFVYTYEGNMARAVQGHRRFEGHRKTIMPDRQLVVKYIDLFSRGRLTWAEFRLAIRQGHRDRVGGPHFRRAGENPKYEENFFANPFPGCICEEPSSHIHS